ncbi:MAG: cytidylate kinase-like family protein [Lachnospiraceae bacterium]|nr:cytidylate kinase-like family protein [Lachnospiraceae bacterium]
MNHIITISRAFGSGGSEIAGKLAKRLNIKYYDKDLLKRAAEESGMAHEIFENHDEKPTSSFLYNLVMDTYSFSYGSSPYVEMPISHKVFLAQFETIKNIAKEGPCIIVGRCADYALAEMDNVINLFIYADLDARVERISKKYNMTSEKAREMIQKKDKQRANYHNFYSSFKWGKADTYDLCIDSHILGIEGTVSFLEEYVRRVEAGKPVSLYTEPT